MCSRSDLYEEALEGYISALRRYTQAALGATQGDDLEVVMSPLFDEIEKCRERWLALDPSEDIDGGTVPQDLADRGGVDGYPAGGEGGDLTIAIRWDVRIGDVKSLADSLGVDGDADEDGFDIRLLSYGFSQMEEPDLSEFPQLSLVRAAVVVSRSDMESDEEFMESPFGLPLEGLCSRDE